MKKNFSTLTKAKKKNPDNFIDIANKKIDEKPPNLIGTKKKNHS